MAEKNFTDDMDEVFVTITMDAGVQNLLNEWNLDQLLPLFGSKYSTNSLFVSIRQGINHAFPSR